MTRLWTRRRTSNMLDEEPRDHPARPRRPGAATASGLFDADERLRHDVGRAWTSPSADLRRRILRGLSDAPRRAAAPKTVRTRAAARPALFALAAAVLLVALISPQVLVPPTAPPSTQQPQMDVFVPPADALAAAPDRPSIMERLLAAPQRRPRPHLEVPLVVEAKLIMQDARDAKNFMLAHIPERYRPQPRPDESNSPIGR